MRALHISSLFVIVVLFGCDSKKEFADFDNEEEVDGFRVSRNEVVLKELGAKKKEIAKQLAEPGEEDVTSWKKTLLTPTGVSPILNFSLTTLPWRICRRGCLGRTALISPS